MDRDELDIYLELAQEAELAGDYRTADKIDGMIKEAQNPAQTLWRRTQERIRGVGNEAARARRQTVDINRGPNFVDRARKAPYTYNDALDVLERDGKLPGQNANVLRSNARLIDRVINALQPTFSNVMTKAKEFPELYNAWQSLNESKIKNLVDAEIARRTTANAGKSPRDPGYLSVNRTNVTRDLRSTGAFENLVGNLENQLVAMRDNHAELIRNAIDEVERTYGLDRTKPGDINKIKARIASEPKLKGMLYDNAFTTEGMIDQVIATGDIPIKRYLTDFGPIKRRMSPAVAALLFGGGVGGITTILRPKGEDKVVYVPVPGKPEALKIDNELEADRRKARQFDTPIADLEAYLNRKKAKGVYTQGKTTKKELYNMAIQEKGAHFANNLIQYVLQKYGLFTPAGGGAEPDATIGV
jgi:predicted small metal-binding protein